MLLLACASAGSAFIETQERITIVSILFPTSFQFRKDIEYPDDFPLDFKREHWNHDFFKATGINISHFSTNGITFLLGLK